MRDTILKKRVFEYWTVWSRWQVCSIHRSCEAAKRAACQCEKKGGMTHKIYKVERMPR